jgi:hypothetical protein
MTATYQVLSGTSVVLTFRADFAQASSPILICDHDGSNCEGTPFQVADARHWPVEAAKLLNRWQRSQGGECWGNGETGLTLRTRR